MANSEEKSKVQRQNRVKRLLSHTSVDSALSITEITNTLKSEGYNINRKTVERDILDISLAYPLSEVETSPRKFYFDGEFKVDFELVFNEDQLQTIILALQSLKQMSPNVLKNLCLEVETTLTSKLPKVLSKEFEHLKSISNAAPTALGEGSEINTGVFHTVLLALRKGRVFECQYFHPDAVQAPRRLRKFAPLMLHFAGVPYIHVYDCDDNEIKLLRISRIHCANLKEEKVDKKRAKEIKLEHVFGGYGNGSEKIINYSVTCNKAMVSRFTENKIHPSQTIEILKNDEYKINFTVHDSTEVIMLLAQYGEFIKKIEPASEYEKVKNIWKKGLGAA